MKEPNTAASADLERFREYLAVLARTQADPRWQGKIDLSGLVQQTLLEAYQASAQLADCNEAQRAAWLRRALANNLNDEIRKLQTAKRAVRREMSLDAKMAESASRLERLIPAPLSTPSEQMAQAERTVRIAQALAALSYNQRQVIELHYLRGQTLVEVADQLQTTKPAVAGLLHRGLKRLREILSEEESIG